MKTRLCLILLLAFFLFWQKAATFLDPDFGWHLQTGKIISEIGVPRTDPFSYTMPSFPYVDHAWLTDVVIAKFYPSLGMVGLGFLVAVILTLALLLTFFSVRPAKNNGLSLGMLLLVVATFLSFVAVRPQIISIFFFSLILWLVTNQNRWEKFKWLVPIIFLFWANLHGGFAAGLILVFLAQIRYRNRLIVLISFGATLINPYGFGLWREVLSTVSDPSLRFAIVEWLPAPLVFNPPSTVLSAVALVVVIYFRKELWPFWAFLFLPFFILGITGAKNLPMLVMVSFPVIVTGLEVLKNQAASNPISAKKLIIGEKVVALLCLGLFLIIILMALPFAVNLTDSYPVKAIEFLRSRQTAGQMFAPYDWGGYLIWKLPGKKTFVDGRMPVWHQQGANAYLEYRELVTGKADIKTAFAKYNIQTVLWPKDSQFLKKVQALGWKEIYNDSKAVVYEME